MSIKSFFVALACVATYVGAQDYCQLCSNHVACNNNGVPQSNCSNIVEITDELKQQIVDLHNRLRNQQASGQTPGYEPAVRMGTIQWDDELSKLAWYNAISCNYGHDPCRKTAIFTSAGQNIAGSSISGTDVSFQSPAYVIDAQTNSWFSEYSQTSMDVIDKFYGDGKGYGHFTQIVHADSDRVGCAMSQYIKPGGWYTNYLVCDYAVTNIIGDPVYEAGATASKCKTGTNPKYSALCSENEQFEY